MKTTQESSPPAKKKPAPEIILLICSFCGTEFEKNYKNYIAKRKWGQKDFFCCNECVRQGNKIKVRMGINQLKSTTVE